MNFTWKVSCTWTVEIIRKFKQQSQATQWNSLLHNMYSHTQKFDFSVTDAESLYDTTANMAQQALKKAEEAYDDSLDIFSTAESIVLPNINVDTMKEDANDIKGGGKIQLCGLNELVFFGRVVMVYCWQTPTRYQEIIFSCLSTYRIVIVGC